MSKDQSESYPRFTRSPFDAGREVDLDLADILDWFLLGDDKWDGVPSGEAIAAALTRTEEFLAGSDFAEESLAVQALLNILRHAFEGRTKDGWSASVKGPRGKRRTRTERAQRAAELSKIANFYEERVAEHGRGSADEARKDTAQEFHCSHATVDDAIKQARKFERMIRDFEDNRYLKDYSAKKKIHLDRSK